MVLSATAVIYLACSTLGADPAKYDPFTGAAEVRRFSFESEDDRDFDRAPDDWTRRKGPSFPNYISTGIDRNTGKNGPQSLRFDVNGGPAIVYSPLIRIDALHSYVFQGYMRTQRLKHDVAFVSVSFLNHKRQRVQRFLNRPVTGTHKDWVRVRIGPLAPRKDVRFVVIGCHLAEGKKLDIGGTIWFDDLWLGMLPQLSLVSNFHTHFVQPLAKIRITSEVSGLDSGHTYQLNIRTVDSTDQVIGATTRPLAADLVPKDANIRVDDLSKKQHVVWELPSQKYGFYRVFSTLERDGDVILEKQTTFAVMDLVERKDRGEFGWSVSEVNSALSGHELADVAAQAGINWIKIPLWESVYSEDQQLPARISELFELLTHRHITTVGLLNKPPEEMRRKFARDWSGISEIFTMSPAFWAPSLDPVIARYSSNVRHWQLGGDRDYSFVGMRALPETIQAVKREFDRIGRDPRIGVNWDWNTPLPSRSKLPHSFIGLNRRKTEEDTSIIEKLRKSDASRMPRWVLLEPLARSKHSLEDRGADLVWRMVDAKIGGAEAIFASDVFDPEHGILNENGSPTPLFLPWRTTALALQGAEYLGSIRLPGGSLNSIFAHENEVVLVVWSPEPIEERIYLREGVVTIDVWGRQQVVPIESGTKRQILNVGPVPKIFRGCSEPVARWRMAVHYEAGRAKSTTEGHTETIMGANYFRQGVNGTATLHLPRGEWQAEPKAWKSLSIGPKEQFKLPTLIKLPPNTTLGNFSTWIEFDIVADRPYKFRVYRDYQVGIGDVAVYVTDRRLADGRLELEQVITNDTSPLETLNFSCSLFVPGRRRQKQLVTKLGRGEDRKLYYVRDGLALRGQELWLRAEQIDGNRVLNFKWTVGKNWDRNNARSKAKQKANAPKRPTGTPKP